MCYGHGYQLRDVPDSPVYWQPYSVGDTIPSTGVAVSTWKDGTPLYFVTAFVISYWYIGYPLPSVPRTFFMRRFSDPERYAFCRCLISTRQIIRIKDL